MYNTKFECRYYKDDVILPEDNVTEYEITYIRNVLYQEDYLQIFSVDDDDSEENINNAIYNLYEKLKNSDIFKMFMKKAAANLISEDLQIGLCILYSYDYMYTMHECVSEYLETGYVSLYNIDKMNKILE